MVKIVFNRKVLGILLFIQSKDLTLNPGAIDVLRQIIFGS